MSFCIKEDTGPSDRLRIQKRKLQPELYRNQLRNRALYILTSDLRLISNAQRLDIKVLS